MRELAPDIAEFYGSPAVNLRLIRSGGATESLMVSQLTAAAEDEAALEEAAYLQLNAATYDIFEQNGLRFEAVIFNRPRDEEAQKQRRVRVVLPQFSTSASERPGELWEMARAAALDPEATIVYISAPGNGKSSPLSREEQRYFQQTGRLTEDVVDEQGEPVSRALPTFVHLAKALIEHDLRPTEVFGTSAGSAYAIALACALPEGQVEYGLFDAHTRWTDSRWDRMTLATLFSEQIVAARRHGRISPDSAVIDRGRRHEVQELRPDIYAHRTRLAGVIGKLATYWTTAVGHAHGLEALQADLRALLARQPQMHADFVVETDDRLQDREELVDSVSRLMEWAPEGLPNFDIRAVLVDGPHDFKRHYPRMFEAITHALAHTRRVASDTEQLPHSA